MTEDRGLWPVMLSMAIALLLGCAMLGAFAMGGKAQGAEAGCAELRQEVHRLQLENSAIRSICGRRCKPGP